MINLGSAYSVWVVLLGAFRAEGNSTTTNNQEVSE